MGTLTYNLVANASRDAGLGYGKAVRKLMDRQGITGPVLVFSHHRIKLVEPKGDSIGTILEYSDPYTNLKTALTSYEARFGQESPIRWMVVPVGQINRAENTLKGFGFMVGSDYVVVEIGRVVYENALPRNGYNESSPTQQDKTKKAGKTSALGKPNLADLLGKVGK